MEGGGGDAPCGLWDNLALLKCTNLQTVQLLCLHTYFAYFTLKVHKIEIFFGFDFEICIISLLVM